MSHDPTIILDLKRQRRLLVSRVSLEAETACAAQERLGFFWRQLQDVDRQLEAAAEQDALAAIGARIRQETESLK